MRSIGGRTLLAGVVGVNARTSLSPLIHNAWAAAAGLDAIYLPFALEAGRFRGFVQALRGSNLRGLNVTIPFKEEALAEADTASPAARAAGAANLLLFDEAGRVHADNTDGAGLLEALSGAGFAPLAGPVVVIGAGGAARGAVAALLAAGVPQVRIVNRDADRARSLASAWPGRSLAYGLAQLDEAVADVSAVVNATSMGSSGQPPLLLPHLSPATIIMDMVYTPLRTPLLQQAAERGNRTADGLSMLIAQARPSFEALFGVAPSEAVDVRRLCEQALDEAP